MLLTIVRKYGMIIVKSMITASGVHLPCFFTKTKLHPGAIKKNRMQREKEVGESSV